MTTTEHSTPVEGVIALTPAEVQTALDMRDNGPSPLTASIALVGDIPELAWPIAHVNAARELVKREHLRREALLDRDDWTPQTPDA